MSRAQLGIGFTRLLAAVSLSNAGDGVRLAAGPLLVATLSTDPVAVAAAVLAQQLPWVAFALPVGAWVDRVERRALVLSATVARTVLAAVLVVALATGVVSLGIVYAALLVIGTAEVVADTAAGALVPALVGPQQLPRANARLSAAFTIGNQFAGPPVGAWLFAIGAIWAFGAEAVAFALAAVLLAALPTTPGTPTAPGQVPPARRRGRLRADVAEGMTFLWRRHALRTLALVLAVMNVTFSAAFATWVLYARQRLGLPATGFGVLLTASAAGALVGAGVAAPLTARLGTPVLLRAGLAIEAGVLAALAAARDPFVAGAAMVVFGAHAAIWGVVATTVRQRLVPDELRGRVGSVYFLLVMGGSALGAALGGVVASAYGLLAPFWIGAGIDAVLLVVVWRALGAAALPATNPLEAGAPPGSPPERADDEPPDLR